jgi:transcriptional regulator GlxA family with amidase domain
MDSDLHTVLVCAGGQPVQWPARRLAPTLRRLARQGVRMGGISGGPYILAAAGLLDNRRFTIHWEHAPALIEALPELSPERARYVIDGNRITCGGGIAPMDMMHAMIAERMGRDFARRVSDWYLHTHVGGGEESQRASKAEAYGTHHPTLLAVLDKMENTLEQPMDRPAMALFAQISERHLDRLFAEHLGTTFQAAYRRIRLEHARQLLQQSTLSVAEVAAATGFASASHFSRQYKALMGKAPTGERAAMRD